MNEFCYVRMDFAKNGLDIVARLGRSDFRFAYAAAGIRNLLRQLVTVALICMEATGGYGQKLATALFMPVYLVAIVDPRRMRRSASTRVIAHDGEAISPAQ